MSLPKRLLSIDTFRAVTMFFMIFVNDLAGAKHVPEWIDHVADNVDGLHFADTIFPAFLFIVGLSLPFSINNRMKKGDSFNSIAFYIITRSLALLIIGFFHVNLEEYSKEAYLPKQMAALLTNLSFFLIWLDYPDTLSKVKKYCLVGLGIATLIVVAALYRGGPAGHTHWMRPSWWGILGIIGWAYLVCASLYLFVKGKFPVIVGILIVFLTINVLSHMKHFDIDVWLIDDASSVSLVMCGVVISMLYAQLAQRGKTQYVWYIFSVLGVLLIAGGLIVRPFAGGISKVYSTPAWVMICSGISILVFELMIFIVDLKGKQNWFSLIRPAGTSTLTCYLIPDLQFSILKLLHIKYPRIITVGAGAIIRSATISLLIIILVGYMEKRKLRLRI